MRRSVRWSLLGITTVLLSSLFLSGCGGLLLLQEDACDGVVCQVGYACVAGECVLDGDGPQPCSSLYPNGLCQTGEQCIHGRCYSEGTVPPPCGPGVDGWCDNGRACVNGTCVDIEPAQACSPDNLTGVCPSNEVCLQGWCYYDPPPCSQAHRDGWCPPGESCLSGSCAAVGTTCSPAVPTGSCPAWQVCVEGECVGPIAPDACSPANPTGRCPAREICVGGTCAPIEAGNACSASNPTGLCDAGAACVNGRCVAITTENGCSSENPTGLCPGGAVCESGACVHHSCGNPNGWLCEPGYYCSGTTCQPLDCDPVHPDGGCPVDEPVCVYGVCLPPECSIDDPDGRCPFGLVCRAGECGIPDCSPTQPNGWCPTGEVCDGTQCVEGPCAPDNLDGTCSGQAITFHPIDGRVFIDEACCDTTMEGVTGCTRGVCSPPPCSIDEPRGICMIAGQYCNDDTCEVAPCGPFFQDGTCPPGQQCVYGTCLIGGCADQPDPDAYCAPDICDVAQDVCVTPPCSAEHPTGYCPIGEACLGGTCGVPNCSPQYPGGECPQDQLCVGGTCVDPPCSATNPSGACGPNFYCNNGTCERLPCGPGAPQGECAPGERCIDRDGAGDIGCEPFACSDYFPTGPCPVGTICQGPSPFGCVTPPCDAEHPGGACGAGEICAGGTCVQQPCSSTYPSGACGPGFTCVAGICQPEPCGRGVPNGSCPIGERCELDVDPPNDPICVVYQCDPDYFPAGPCPIPGEVCNAGVCEVPQCSPQYPGGDCPVAVPPQVCSGGGCVELPCSPAIPNGACPANQICCDAVVAGVRGCFEGTCVIEECAGYADLGWCPPGDQCVGNTCYLYECSGIFPTGPCAVPGEVCNAGSCEVPACSATYPGGDCPVAVPPQVCSGGTCVELPCSPSVTNGACPPSQVCCDAGLAASRGCTEGTCVLGDCSPAITNGRCPAGEICCDADLVTSGFCVAGEIGTCLPTNCSPAFPFGACPGSQICAGGTCVDPCDDAHRLGWCPTSFACVEARCSLECTNDADCDGISNTDEDIGTLVDTDGDGSPDAYDRDSDGDVLPDAVEAGDLDIGTAPDDFDGDGTADFRERDSDKDHISDTFEAGPAPGVPVDTDTDGEPDYRDLDSDADGILDACEVADIGGICAATGIVDIDLGSAAVLDSDALLPPPCDDGLEDFRDPDSDCDGISDHIEARARPADDGTFDANGVDHDADGTPDYRDLDSDADGVADADEDVNGDGIVNCQVDGTGAIVDDPRPTPVCGGSIATTQPPFAPSYPYDYNPGCPAQKCMLAETSRVHPDTDGDGNSDGDDGIFLVCSTANLKPINVFYSQPSDYALALEQSFDRAVMLARGGVQVGMTFDDAAGSNGSTAVAGFILSRTPDPSAIAASDPDPGRVLIAKALAQEIVDRGLLGSATGVTSVASVINRNFMSFDGYGVVTSRYNVTAGSTSTWELRDRLAASLDGSVTGYSGLAGGGTATDFTLLMETLYRYDDGTTQGRVIVIGAVVPTGVDFDHTNTYNYRTRCALEPIGTCATRTGCVDNAGVCEEDPSYQIPLFFADNITNGSAVTQYGDDLDSLCQTLLQQTGVIDFLWVVDDSGSMQQEIRAVQVAAQFFFPLLDNSEADYRVGQVTMYENQGENLPEYDFGDPAGDASLVVSSTNGGRRNGFLLGDFTGAISGQLNYCGGIPTQYLCDRTTSCYWSGGACQAIDDRSVTYDCAAGCDNLFPDCCPACGTGLIDNPMCYFASRLPPECCRGEEWGLLMGQWATYRYGATPICDAITGAGACDATPGCKHNGTYCMPSYCELPWCDDPALDTRALCEAVAGCFWNGTDCQVGLEPTAGEAGSPMDECNGYDPGQTPSGLDGTEDELELGSCEWHPQGPGGWCSNYTTAATCLAPCRWNGSACLGACWPSVGEPCHIWNGNQTQCTNRAPRCAWDAGNAECAPSLTWRKYTLCSDDSSQANCEGLGECVWDLGPDGSGGTGDEFCRPPFRRAFRAGATRVAVALSDEEAQSSSSVAMTSARRLGREASYLKYYQALDFLYFAIVGDKGTSCATAPQAGESYIFVAEGTGGGWGSICAADPDPNQLYPTIEAIMLGSLGKASPYTLEGFIVGQGAVQPISSTIKVTVEVCDIPAEYPVCASGTHMAVVPRSRDAGFDYDGINNTLLLYGAARPVLDGKIVASYRYWIDKPQPPEGDLDCPCPQTNLPGCDCPQGQACGISGELGGTTTDNCTAHLTQEACEETPGCAWNSANSGLCMATGLCEPDPTCGGLCAPGTICDPVLGLCVCDVTCGGLCGAGQTCDNNNNIHACNGLVEASCNSPCLWDAARGACYSPTCGQCLCDTTCGGGCPVGQLCNSSPGPTCGQCTCDTTCGTAFCSTFATQGPCETAGCFWDTAGSACVGCDTTLTCDNGSICAGLAQPACTAEPSCEWDGSSCYSPTCGFCSPPQCGSCPPGTVCDPATGLCVCDPTCGGGCQDGRYCETTPGPTCGLCLCDTSCGSGCQLGQLCDDNAACDGLDTAPGSACESTAGCFVDPAPDLCYSDFCGLCVVDPTCGGIPCNADCITETDPGICDGRADCRWAPWLGGGAGECSPVACRMCNSSTGLCVPDPSCCGCGPGETCNPVTGECDCAVDCSGGGCPVGQLCDVMAANPACTECVCDPTCGGSCPAGQLCDDGAACAGLDPSPGGACESTPGCFVDSGGACASLTCGLCVVDPTCGGPCNPDCDVETDPAACNGRTECRWAPWLGASGECVPIQCDVCNTGIGLCVPDPTCCGCGPTEICNPATGECECDTNCGFACAPGLTCDSNLASPTCGQCFCDTTCGGSCPPGLVCDDNARCAGLDEPTCGTTQDCSWDATFGCVSTWCGRCIVDPTCGGVACNPDCSETDPALCDADPECRWGDWLAGGAGACTPIVCQECDSSTGLCAPDPTCCDACGPGEICDWTSGICICDQSCGGACPLGRSCDGDLTSPTCGECLCDPTCGGSCPTCQVCDSDLGSGTCGMCVVDDTCGGGCGPGEQCDPLTGCCITDPNCGGYCPPGYVCDPLTGKCVYDDPGG